MELTDGWQLAGTPAGLHDEPTGLDGFEWAPARIPGTVAAALGAGADRNLDAEDWWFRTHFAAFNRAAGERVALELDGIATASEVFLNGERVLRSASMWAAHEVDVTDRIRAENELVIVCRALRPALEVSRRPRARWRTRVVRDGNLRWHRTMLFGRSPGFAPGPAPVGPWRPVRLVRRGSVRLAGLSWRARIDGQDGVVEVRAAVHGAGAVVRASIGGVTSMLTPAGDGLMVATFRLPDVKPWWPHTHGSPELYELRVTVGEQERVRRVGFRTLEWAGDPAEEGLALSINGVPVFARGAVWTPPDLISMAPSRAELRALLEQVRDGGMNMLRVVGTGAYESPEFFDLCDELGILVWQDLMFANLDYPLEDPDFRAEVEHEVQEVLARIGPQPSLTVVCGNSEVEQQPAMMGLDPALGRHEFWERTVPELLSANGIEVAYLRSTPCGGALPFHADRGVTHYFGVSGYFHPPADARRAGVRFAAECLAFANVPDEVTFPVHHPEWKRGVARDAGTGWDLGAGWDFDDVRDHYLRLLFDVDPVQLRRADHGRYLELSRFASAEVMSEVIGEWRRSGSPCRGALVLWLKDMLPGAGLGVLDSVGRPKVAYHHLRRAFAPVAVWMTDEGVNGVHVHVANDRAEPLRANLRIALYRGEARVAQATEELVLPAHDLLRRDVEGLIGFFTDAAWAYHFGPPTHDAIVASLERTSSGELISQSFFFPAGRPLAPRAQAELGLRAVGDGGGEDVELTLSSARLAYGVRVHAAGYRGDDDAFSVEPGGTRRVRLTQIAGNTDPRAATITALNLETSIKIEWPA